MSAAELRLPPVLPEAPASAEALRLTKLGELLGAMNGG